LKETVEETTKNIKRFQIVGMNHMEQRSVVILLRLKGLSKKTMHYELVAVFQENAVSYSSMTRFCRETILGLNSEEASSPPKDNGLDEVNETILLALSDDLFSSVGQIARRTCFPKSTVSTVYRRLVDSLHFTIRHQTSSLGSSQALRESEGKLSRVVDPTSRRTVVHPASKMVIHINL
jgi:hypothetical protein